MNYRRKRAKELRYMAADMAYDRPHRRHVNNGDENKYRKVEKKVEDGVKSVEDNGPSFINTFTKGFFHEDSGLMKKTNDYEDFIRASDSGDLDIIAKVKLNKDRNWKSDIAQNARGEGKKARVRGWESMGSGLTYDLEGPDAQSVCIPPAPCLDSQEMISELAEVYWMALCRDVPFAEFSNPVTPVADAIMHLNSLSWIRDRSEIGLRVYERMRKRGYFMPGSEDAFDGNTIFRGNVMGDDIGFHISQFLYVGNQARGEADAYGPDQGLINYGSTTINQRVRIATPHKDYMITWEHWLDVQNGADLRGLEGYVSILNGDVIDPEMGYRFITTPRDLATYVHYDALHQAYFNACIIMLNISVKFDPGIPFGLSDKKDSQIGFATFGGPHILNLVSEVATRALKAVRYQKYNVHRRARPEQICGWVDRYKGGITTNLEVIEKIIGINGLGDDLLAMVMAHNAAQNEAEAAPSWLLPMPFTEGSPMHPTYGSGHATVAGACVTILKAFFDEGFILPFAYMPSDDGRTLVKDDPNLGNYTVGNELNKLAANIAFGRNWAGVHYYSDQIESLRLGEQIALGILEEQKLMYGENFSMNVPLFDGTTIRI